jgi:flagellar basal body-associated protein FliL
MSEESQEGGMSTIKKTIIGVVTTMVTAAGAYVTTQFNEIFGIEDEEKTEEVAPVQQTQSPAPIILNVDNSSTNSNQGGGTTVIKETKVVEKPVKEEKSESEDAPW